MQTNRLEQMVFAPTQAPTEELQIDSGKIQRYSPEVPYSLFGPLHYEKHYAYPLLVWLHGPGQSESQLRRVMPQISMRNYVGVAPRGSVPFISDSATDSDVSQSYDWGDSADQIEAAQHRVWGAVETAAAKFNISASRLFLAGFGTGATMAYRIALRQPERFAGILAIGGAFPRGQNPLACIKQARHLPVMLACGRASKQYPEKLVCDDLRLLHSSGLSVTLRQYGCGQEIDPQMLHDADQWMMDAVTNPGAICSSQRSL